MIHVALTCTRSMGFNGDRCPDFHDTIDPAEAEAWYQAKIRENAWTEENGKPYCPRHNPADIGDSTVAVRHDGERYVIDDYNGN